MYNTYVFFSFFRYKKGSLNVWCNFEKKKVLITLTHKRPNRSYVNVKYLQSYQDFKQGIDIDIVRCLVINQVPKNKDPCEVFLVLTCNGSQNSCYEVRGICEKSNGPKNLSTLSLIKTDVNIETSMSASTFVHRTMNNDLKIIPLVKRRYFNRNLSYIHNPLYTMTFPLPDIKENEKWCMISLQKKFAFVLFADIPYSIKRTDIIDLIEVARNCKHTLVLEAKHFNQGNTDFKQNIYIAPNRGDKFFVGPFHKTENANIKILKYLNSVLVNCGWYDKGKDGEISPYCLWLTQVYKPTTDNNKQSLLLKNPTMTLELVTLDNNDDGSNHSNNNEDTDTKEAVNAATSDNTQDDDDDDDVVLVKDKEYIEKSDLKRYFITNVKGLGYIEGIQLPQSKIIDVKWPFSNNIQRYSKVEDALGGIQRFDCVFVIIYLTFTIFL